GLSAPLLLSALPLRVATFSLQGPERSKVQLLIHADIGTDYTAAKRLSIAYAITDADGRTSDSQTTDARVAPIMTGVPSPLQSVAGATLPPGDYTLKLVVADGDKVGSVEHPIRAQLVDAGAVRLSELMVGGPVDPTERLRPTIGYTVSFGVVHGYVEAYGADAQTLEVTYEIATDDKAPPMLTADVPSQPAGESRILLTRMMVVNALPPGRYVLRAVVTSAQQPVKRMLRAFEVAAPAVLMSSASGLGDSPSTDGELFLPIDEHALAAPFRRDDAIK